MKPTTMNETTSATMTDNLQELNWKELESVSGGIFRITNVRLNANGITGGGPGPIPARCHYPDPGWSVTHFSEVLHY